MKVQSSYLARKVLKELCKDTNISALNYDVFYQHEQIECDDVNDIFVVKQGVDIVVGVETVKNENIHLFVLEVNDAMLSAFYGAYCSDDIRKTHELAYERIASKCKEITSRMLKEFRQIGVGAKTVRYAILEGEGALSYSIEELSGCGDFLLPQYSWCIAKNECITDGDDVIMDIIMNHRNTVGFYVSPGRMIVYQFEGDKEVHAVLLKAFERPSLKNCGGCVDSSMYQEAPTYNYTLNTVANERYVFLFDRKEVVPVEKVDMEGMYLAADLSWEKDEWIVVSRMDSGIGKFSVASCNEYADCRQAIGNMIRQRKDEWSNKTVAEVSLFGLESIEREKYRRVREGIVMTDGELVDALSISGLEITGAPGKLARFMEALAVVTERLNAE